MRQLARCLCAGLFVLQCEAINSVVFLLNNHVCPTYPPAFPLKHLKQVCSSRSVRAIEIIQVSVLVLGGLLGLGAGNLSLRLLFSHDIADAEKRRTPSAAAFRRSVLAVALMSSTAMAFGGPPAALTDVARPLVLGVFAVICAVALGGCCWGLFGGAGRSGVGARQAYGTVASDDHEVEVELKPFAADDGPDGRAEDDDYLDEEDGYLADEGEIEVSSRRGGKGQPVRGSRVIRSSLTAPHSLPAGGSREKTVEGKREKKVRWEAPPAHSLFPEGHTMEL